MVTFLVTYRLNRGVDRRARLPVLVFIYEPERGWLIRNVGNGPALNVVVARHSADRGWFDAVRVPPLRRDAECELTYLDHWDTGTLGATYEDFLSADRAGGARPYTVTCGQDRNQVRPGRRLGALAETDSLALWERAGR
jgi:hypothetical protein